MLLLEEKELLKVTSQLRSQEGIPRIHIHHHPPTVLAIGSHPGPGGWSQEFKGDDSQVRDGEEVEVT